MLSFQNWFTELRSGIFISDSPYLEIILLACGKYPKSPHGTWNRAKVCIHITDNIMLHWLCPVSNTWTVPQTAGDAPCAREGHSAAVIGTRMYIFGGCGRLTDDSDDSYFNDLYFLETSNCSYFLSLWIFLGGPMCLNFPLVVLLVQETPCYVIFSSIMYINFTGKRGPMSAIKLSRFAFQSTC